MNAVTKVERPQRSVLVDMSTRYGMEPAAFEATVRATCMPPDRNNRVPTREEFAAFLLVAKEYKLNPLTKEIYAFPAKSGGIVPIVSIDGWVNLVNSHPACDGFEFEFEHDAQRNLVSCTCRMFRKDRGRPVTVTEYLAECIRSTDPWKMKHRMLRHKAMIQAARYAFGFSGIYDEDEGEKIAEAPARGSVTLVPPDPSAHVQIEHQSPAEAPTDAGVKAGGSSEVGDPPDPNLAGAGEDESDFDLSALLANLDEELGLHDTEEDINEAYMNSDVDARLASTEDGVRLARDIKERHFQRVRLAADKRQPAGPTAPDPIEDYRIGFLQALNKCTEPDQLGALWREHEANRKRLQIEGDVKSGLYSEVIARKKVLKAEADKARG